MSQITDSPFELPGWYDAAERTLWTLEPGVTYTLVRNRDNSDAGISECFFTDPDEAAQYVSRLVAAFEAGALGEPNFHPQPDALDLEVYTVMRNFYTVMRNS